MQTPIILRILPLDAHLVSSMYSLSFITFEEVKIPNTPTIIPIYGNNIDVTPNIMGKRLCLNVESKNSSSYRIIILFILFYSNWIKTSLL